MNRFFVQFEAFVYNPPHSRIPAVYFEIDEETGAPNEDIVQNHLT